MSGCTVPQESVRHWLAQAGAAWVLCAALAGTAAAADAKSAAAAKVDPEHAAKMAKGLEIFKQYVRPVLVKNCVKCHGGESVKNKLDLTDRERLLRGGESGPAVVVGDPKESLLYLLASHVEEPHMPQDGEKLPDEALARIAAWIENGAPYDAPLVAGKGEAESWTERTVPDEARKFWSLQPLRRVDAPGVHDEAWCRTPADRFILAKLEAAGLKPHAAASKRQLARRAYFDLTGLPPTPEELDSFLSDTSPEAYEKLIDRLLASPHYGERWARHWLDVARFAESHGFEHDYDRPSAYHYRDFVIKALNDDLPFDTFVKWQLAGDEFEPSNNLALTATGFLAAGVHATQITQKEVAKHRYDEMDDMVATTGTAMLGLTMGCARCHDHKYDPIPQRDYYAMLSTFTTTVRSEIDLDLDPEGYKKAKAAFELEHAPYAAAVEKFEAEEIPVRSASWEKSWTSPEGKYPWTILDLVRLESKEGVTLAKQDDGSVLATGKNPKFDTYTLVAHTDLAGIKAVRLEALADLSLAKGGPGRSEGGNFALSDFSVTVAPKSGEGKPVEVRLRRGRATFEQAKLPVTSAIDADDKSAWGVDPQVGKDHAAVFEPGTELGFPGGTVLTVTMRFEHSASQAIGRPRLSVATAPGPVELLAAGVPEHVRRILGTAAEKRTAEQAAALRKWYRTIDPAWLALDRKAQEHLLAAPKPKIVKALVASEGLPPVRLHTQGDDFFPETHFLRRGDPNQKDGVAPQSFVQVLMTAAEKEKHWRIEPPKGWRTSYRRRALADWITDAREGAGPLLARVIVNRLWQHHLGAGIVATPSDFGTRGEAPTHPELLDWLASELVASGWRLKPIHKLIMLSAVYTQGSDVDPAKARIDPDNRLLWRRPVRRLEAEVIRDALLAVSGALDTTMYGPGTLDEASRRRSIYFTVKRSKLVPMMQVFDAPDGLQGAPARPTTTIAPQALLLMNNPNVRQCAKSFARRVASDAKTPAEEAVRRAYQLALARSPTEGELADAVSFLKGQIESHKSSGKGDGRELALTDFCQALFCVNEFVYVD